MEKERRSDRERDKRKEGRRFSDTIVQFPVVCSTCQVTRCVKRKDRREEGREGWKTMERIREENLQE